MIWSFYHGVLSFCVSYLFPFIFICFLNVWASMFLNIHSLMSILIILACHTMQCFLLSFEALGSKEAIHALHKNNHVISYNDIRMQNAAWSRMVSEDRLHFPSFHKSVTTHRPTDNNDRRQETLTGYGTKHDTKKTIFQVLSTGQMQNLPMENKRGHSF